MADIQKKIIVKLDLQGIKGSDQKLGELDQQIARLSKRQKELKKETKGGTAASAEQKKEAGNLTKRLANLRQEKSKLTRQTKKLNEGQKANTRTIAGLRERNRALVAEMNRLDISTKKGQARLKLLRQEFLANDAQVRKFDQSLGRHQANVGNYRSGLAGVKAGLTAMAAGITAAVMAFQRINAMMRESIELFKTQELAERQLTFAAGDAAGALIEQAAALQQQTTFGDEATIQMQAMLASFGSTTEQIKTLTPLILDYAAASGKDLSTASMQLNNILNGTSTTLRGTSIRLSETATSAERYEAVLAELNQHQGSAAALADTYSGRLDQLKNDYNDQREELGAKLIPIKIAFMEAVVKTIKFIRDNREAILGLVSSYGIFVASSKLASAGSLTLARSLVGVRRAIQAINLAVRTNPIGAIATALTVAAGAALTFARRTKEANQQLTAQERINKEVAESITNVNDTLAKETANVTTLIGVIKDENASKEQKKIAIQRLNDSYGGYIGNINLEKASLEEINDLQEEILKGLQKKIIMQAFEEELAEAYGKQADAIRALNKEQQEYNEEIKKIEAIEQEYGADADTETRRVNAELSLTVASMEIYDAEQQVKTITSEFEALSEELGFDLYDAFGKSTAATEASTTATEASTEAIEKGITRKQLYAKAAEGMQQKVDATVESLNQLQGAYIETGEQANLYAVDTDEAMQKQAQFQENLTKAQMALEALKGISLNDAINQLAAMTEETTKFERNLVLIGASVTALNDIFATRFENQKQRIEQQTLAEKEAIEQSTMSEEQKRIAIERAEQKKATEIEKIQQKQAKQQKANAIIESLINTALGITKALATFGPFAFGVIPAIAAIGAVQTGIIAAQQFAEGGQVAELGSGEGGVIPANLQNIPALSNGDNVLATVKTGEVILNDAQQNRLMQLTSPDIFRAIKVPNFADGGVVPSFQSSQQASTARIEAASQNVADTVQRIKVVNVASDTQGMAVRVQNIEGEASIG